MVPVLGSIEIEASGFNRQPPVQPFGVHSVALVGITGAKVAATTASTTMSLLIMPPPGSPRNNHQAISRVRWWQSRGRADAWRLIDDTNLELSVIPCRENRGSRSRSGSLSPVRQRLRGSCHPS